MSAYLRQWDFKSFVDRIERARTRRLFKNKSKLKFFIDFSLIWGSYICCLWLFCLRQKSHPNLLSHCVRVNFKQDLTNISKRKRNSQENGKRMFCRRNLFSWSQDCLLISFLRLSGWMGFRNTQHAQVVERSLGALEKLVQNATHRSRQVCEETSIEIPLLRGRM